MGARRPQGDRADVANAGSEALPSNHRHVTLALGEARAQAYTVDMSSVDVTARQQRVVGRPFQPGQSGNPAGRPRGARSKLAECFIADLHDAWQKHGVQALEACAVNEPATFVKVIAGLMPKDVNLNVDVDAVAFVDRFRAAQEMLGNGPMKVINGR